jgi:leucyl-tRNA synthetase
MEKIPARRRKKFRADAWRPLHHTCAKRSGATNGQYKESIAYATWPTYDPESFAKNHEIEIVVQVNGKKRGSVFVRT